MQMQAKELKIIFMKEKQSSNPEKVPSFIQKFKSTSLNPQHDAKMHPYQNGKKEKDKTTSIDQNMKV